MSPTVDQQSSLVPQASEGAAMPYLAGLAMVALATAIGRGIEWLIAVPNISLVYVAAILMSAWRHGLWPAVATALVSVAAYNWFFIPPLHTFTVADPANVVALVFFLVVAVLTGTLAARAREQALTVRHQARITAALYDFTGKLAAIADLDDLLWATAHQIALMLKVEVVLLLPEAGRLAVRAGFPPEDTLDDVGHAAAIWTWERDAPTGLGGRRLFLPLRTERGRVGVLGIVRAADNDSLTPSERQLLDALADQAAVAVERIQLARDVDEARIRAEGDRLRAALLTSVSHDLKTPLASIIGTLSSLKSYSGKFDEATHRELLGTALEEAERLNRFVANLLDMTRLDSGAVAPKRESVDAGELIGAAVRRAQQLLSRHEVALDIAPDLPPLPLDFVLTEQALFNLLDNAAKYAPEGTTVAVSAARAADGVAIAVTDEGPGIPETELERIFDKFHRVRQADRQRAGTGLGLAIARGFAAAQGGTLTAAKRTDRSGARFTFRFPL
jgi:two-component system, OmpR family, sensor histidine kinase KdpD